MKPKTPKQALLLARALIKKGWTQGVNQEGDCFCAQGALLFVCSFDREYDTLTNARIKLWRAIRETFEDIPKKRHFSSITLWNDADGRTQAEVLAVYDRAIVDPAVL